MLGANRGLLLYGESSVMTKFFSNDDPGLTLTYFTARSNLVPYALYGKKVKQWIFYALNSKKLTGHIGFGLCVRPSVSHHIKRNLIFFSFLFFFFYAHNFEEVAGAYWFRVVLSSKNMHARLLKFHIWIPHGKIAGTRFFCFFFLDWVIFLSGAMPLWKNRNEILCMPYLMNRAC